jgi:hypothetical protein
MKTSKATEIRELVIGNSTMDALNLLLKLSKPNKNVYDTVLIILGEFNDLISQQLRGIIDNAEVSRRKNLIHNKILIILDLIEKNDGDQFKLNDVIPQFGRTTKFLLFLGLSLFFLGVAFLLTGFALASYQKNQDLQLVYFIIGYYIISSGIVILCGWFIVVIIKAIKEDVINRSKPGDNK